MTDPTEQPRRTGTVDDITGLRLYYRVVGEPDELHVDWRNDRGPTIAEAIAVKAATVSKVNLPRMLAVVRSHAEAQDDPEAAQALVWMLRCRAGEQLPITDLAGLDLLSLREEYLDAQGAELDFEDDEPTDEQRQQAADLAAELQRRLPGLPNPEALGTAAALIVAYAHRDPAGGDVVGEDEAGAEPAGGEAETTTPTTPKRSPRSGSRSSRPRTGSAPVMSTATRPGPG